MTKQCERLELLSASPGTRRHLVVHRYRGSADGPKAYFQGALHADETPGTLVAHHLIRRLDAEAAAGRVRGEVVVVPVANPIGLSQVVAGRLIGRFDLTSRGNFNRDFPDVTQAVGDAVASQLGCDAAQNVRLIRAAFGAALAALEPVTEVHHLKVTLLRLAHDADVVLDMHCDSVALPHLYLSTASWPEGRDLSAALGSRATLLALDSGGSSFDEVFSLLWHRLAERFGPDLPIPMACLSGTAEYRGQLAVSDAEAEADADGLIQFLRHRGILDGPAALPPPQCEATPLEATEVVKAPTSGILVLHRRLGERLAKGDVFASIIDPMAEDQSTARTSVTAGTDGLFLTHCLHRQVRAGQGIAKIVGTVPLPSRTGVLVSE